MHPLNVIIRPVISEKSNSTREVHGKYTFIVRPEATKKDVESAVKRFWNVEVDHVRTIITRGKIKRRGARVSKASNTKKAIVTLVKGAKLPLFEDQ